MIAFTVYVLVMSYFVLAANAIVQDFVGNNPPEVSKT